MYFILFYFEQLSESLHQLQAERDQYVEKLKEERSIWQQRVQQLSEQVTSGAVSQLLLTNTGRSKCTVNTGLTFTCVALQVHTMAEEKEKHMAQIQELEANVTELLNKSGRASTVGLHIAEYQLVNSVPAVQELLHMKCK